MSTILTSKSEGDGECHGDREDDAPYGVIERVVQGAGTPSERCIELVSGDVAGPYHVLDVLSCDVHAGDLFDASLQHRLERSRMVRQGRDMALKYMAMAAHSRFEVQRYLALKRGIPPAVAESLVQSLKQEGYLDDLALCLRLVEQAGMQTHPPGTMALSQRLQRRGLDKETIRAALAQAGYEEFDGALGQGERKLPELRARVQRLLCKKGNSGDGRQELYRLRESLAGFLARKGYGQETVRAVVERLLGD